MSRAIAAYALCGLIVGFASRCADPEDLPTLEELALKVLLWPLTLWDMVREMLGR